MTNQRYLWRIYEAIEEKDPELAQLHYDREVGLIREILDQYLLLISSASASHTTSS